MPAPWEENIGVLERGYPDEILPEKLFQWKGLAHRYIREDHPQEAKDRVESVWIKGERQPPWQPVTPVPDYLRGMLPKSMQEPEQETKETDASTDFG